MMRPGARQYVVNRPLYSEDSFADEHEKVCRRRKTMLDHIKLYFTCDAKRAKNAALSLLPVIGWMRIYRVKEWLLPDVVSGISTGLVAVLQGERRETNALSTSLIRRSIVQGSVTLQQREVPV
ncbi:Chloride anion exchanger [Oryzias melastigma]|uniref:Chloride anion exchanger n=1 Tax=Oryzias melastigma TaxID=30732 RepID=A0A834CF36_ORYME|nr:Chloride anion exchanger [Oryzias melastigma]